MKENIKDFIGFVIGGAFFILLSFLMYRALYWIWEVMEATEEKGEVLNLIEFLKCAI